MHFLPAAPDNNTTTVSSPLGAVKFDVKSENTQWKYKIIGTDGVDPH